MAMVDAGGGTFLRFGEAGAKLSDLSVIAISHLYPDHVSDLPGILWLSDAVRERPIALVGPSAGGVFPDIAAFVGRLFDSNAGAFPILGGTVRDAGRGVPLDVRVVDVTGPASTVLVFDDGLELSAMGVPHPRLWLTTLWVVNPLGRRRPGRR